MEHGRECVLVDHVRTQAQSQRFAAVASSIIMLVLVIVGLFDILPFPQDVSWTFLGTSAFSVALHSWVLAAADLETMKQRMEYGTFSNTLIVTAFCMLALWRVGDMPASCRIALEAGATFFPPLVHSKCTHGYQSNFSWAVGIVLHYAVVAKHHWHHSTLSEGWQWLLVLLIVDILILDSTQIRLHSNSLLARLEKAYEKMAELSNDNTRKMFVDFCDAEVLLNSDGEVCEPPTRLATLLGKSAGALQGLSFTALLCPDEVEKYDAFMKDVAGESGSGSDSADQRTHSVRVDLEGLYGIRIPVVLFHAQYRTGESSRPWMSFIGISEAWQPKKVKSKPSARGGGLAREVPVSSSFHQPLEDASAGARERIHQRPDSPRPGKIRSV